MPSHGRIDELACVVNQSWYGGKSSSTKVNDVAQQRAQLLRWNELGSPLGDDKKIAAGQRSEFRANCTAIK